MASDVHVIEHPVVQHKLALLRRKSTSTSEFRSLVAEVSMLLAYEVTRAGSSIELEATGIGLAAGHTLLVDQIEARTD